jgi:hypothetical protein
MCRPLSLVKLLGAVAVCAFALQVPAHAAELRHLFLDPAFLVEKENVMLRVNPAQQRETVIRPDRPWEQLMISFYLTVLEDGGKLRMWYICRDKKNQPNVAYAESTDGVTWIKPNLGIVEYEGSKENNLVGLTSLEGTVYIDERAPADERYCYITHLITEGMEINGFALDNCDVIRTNATRALVTWKGGGDLSSLKDRDVRVAFQGRSTQLFSFYFVSEAP